ncbi:MAG: hypothetical protein DMD28_12080 [Gemmatimonadetes bacterium]|nr:MAG: hypothetical protein DMD28_12080 [Gemmatimonadota bacterium]
MSWLRQLVLMGLVTLPPFVVPRPVVAQKRALTFDDFIALPSVGDPQLSPDGRRVAYTVTTYSLQDNRGTGRIWIADVATGEARQLTQGPGSDRQPRWSPDGSTLGFVSTRQGSSGGGGGGPQLWVLTLSGGEARKVTNLPDGVSDPVWLPDGKGLLVTSDIKWPAEQEIDRRNGNYPTDARLWTDLFYRHWDDWRAGRRQHVFSVSLAEGHATDLMPVDRDVPTIATSGDGDVSVSPDGREIAVAIHGEPVADNTNVDIYVMVRDGGRGTGDGAMRQVSSGRGSKRIGHASCCCDGRTEGRKGEARPRSQRGGRCRWAPMSGAQTRSASTRWWTSAEPRTCTASTFRPSVIPSPFRAASTRASLSLPTGGASSTCTRAATIRRKCGSPGGRSATTATLGSPAWTCVPSSRSASSARSVTRYSAGC